MSNPAIPPVWAAGQRWTFVGQDEMFAHGMCDAGKSQIIIRSDFIDGDPNALRKLVMHELLHAIDNSADLLAIHQQDPGDQAGGAIIYDEKPDGTLVKYKPFFLSERLVSVLSESIWITFSDPRNADFMRWLLTGVWAEAWRLFAQPCVVCGHRACPDPHH